MRLSTISFYLFLGFVLLNFGILSKAYAQDTLKLYSDEDSAQVAQVPINPYVVDMQTNNDAVPGDTTRFEITDVDPEAGTHSLILHIVGGPNPRGQFDTWDGIHAPLDASKTEKVTFWVKSPLTTVDNDTLIFWFWSEDASYTGNAGQSARIAIGGETVFDSGKVIKDVPWNGKWQFVSIPWSLLKSNDTSYVKNTFHWSWTRPVSNFDNSMIRSIKFDSGEKPANYPLSGPITPDKGYIHDFHIDEVYFVKGTTTGINDKPELTPDLFKLHQNYPNPFNPSTSISFDIPTYANVNLTIYNMLGQTVRKLIVNKFSDPGSYSVTWDGRNDAGQIVPSGQYVYRIQASHYTASKKMIFLK